MEVRVERVERVCPSEVPALVGVGWFVVAFVGLVGLSAPGSRCCSPREHAAVDRTVREAPATTR